VSASIYVEKLIGDHGKHNFQNISISSSTRAQLGESYVPFNTRNSEDRTSRDPELTRLSRQVIQQIEDAKVYFSILQEVQSLLVASSEHFSPSVEAALSSCLAQNALDDCRQDLADETEGKEYQKLHGSLDGLSYYLDNSSLDKSLLIMRRMLGSQQNQFTLRYRADRDINIVNKENRFQHGVNLNLMDGPEAGEIVIGVI
jgi:hypothetical protein